MSDGFQSLCYDHFLCIVFGAPRILSMTVRSTRVRSRGRVHYHGWKEIENDDEPLFEGGLIQTDSSTLVQTGERSDKGARQ